MSPVPQSSVPVTQSEPLRGGLSGSGVTKHMIYMNGAASAVCLVEKRLPLRARSLPEYEICRSIFEQAQLGVTYRSLPTIISATCQGTHYSVIMPYYVGINAMMEDEEAHARLIARAVVDFNRATLDFTRNDKFELLQRRLREFAAEGAGAALAALKQEILELSGSPLPEAMGHPLVQSHNDVFFPNLATQHYDRQHGIILVDFGLAGLNAVGADFHHFVKAAVTGKLSEGFLDTLFAEYAALTGVPETVLRLNAHEYALLRQFARMKKLCAPHRAEQLAVEMAAAGRLLEGARTQRRRLAGGEDRADPRPQDSRRTA